jgi:hypothetical protein
MRNTSQKIRHLWPIKNVFNEIFRKAWKANATSSLANIWYTFRLMKWLCQPTNQHAIFFPSTGLEKCCPRKEGGHNGYVRASDNSCGWFARQPLQLPFSVARRTRAKGLNFLVRIFGGVVSLHFDFKFSTNWRM